MDKQVKSIFKRTAAAALSAAMVLTMGLGAVPSVVYAGDLSGAEARNETQEVKIDLSEIDSMSAKTYGPQSDGDTLEASFDGDTTTYTNSNYNDPANGKPQVYTFNFADTVDLCKVRIHPRNSGGNVGNGAPNSCTVEVSTDGVQYTQVAQSAVTDTSLTWTDIAFAAVPASSVRLTLDSAHEKVVTTGEVELYKLVSEPSGADKTALDAAISTIAAKMEGLDKADYVTATWEALETALSAAQAVSADPDATEEQVAGALADLQAADAGLSLLVSPVYMTDFVSYENGRVTVELNGPTNYIPDGSTTWTYEYKDGKHLLYTDDWDNNALTSEETENYREVCIYDLNKKNPEWSYIYIDEDGNGTIAGTSYNAEKPKGTLIAGGKEYDITDSGDLEEIEDLKFTATPIVTLKGVNLSDVTRQRRGVGENAVDVEVTDPTRTSVEIPLVNQKGSAASGTYSISTHWADGKVLYYNDVKINSVSIIDRSDLEEAIEAAEALTETDYTPDSWAAMQEKLAEAKDTLADCIATSTEVQSAADALNEAVEALVDTASAVDKTKLQSLYDEADAAEFIYQDATLMKYFNKALADAEEVLDDPNATQEDVDSAYYYLEKHYWQNVIEDKVAYYNPTKNGEDGRFDYSDKVTQSILPLLSAYQQTHNVNNNTEMDKLSSYYEIWEKAEKCTPETADEDMRGVEVGINTSADGFDTKDALSSGNTGHFEITGQEFTADDTGKVSVKVTFQFINDGLNPITGEEKGAYSFSEMKKASCRVSYESPSGKGSKGVTITDRSEDSLTGEFTVNEDSVISLSLEDSTMLGFFKVQKFTPADKTDLESVIAAAQEFIDQEYNYIKDADWDAFIESYNEAVAVNEDPLASQDDVTKAWRDLLLKSASINPEKQPPVAVFVINGTDMQITDTALLNEEFGLKFTDNGKLSQFVLNGTEFTIDGTEDTVTFADIQDALQEGNGEAGKNTLTVRDSVLLGDSYYNERTYTFYFDQTAPELEAAYSETEPTNNNVTVTVTSNEALDAAEIPEGWTLSDDGMSASKTYEANAEETVTFKDLAGNETAVSVKIDNIDKTAPETEVSYSETEPTNKDVTVTVTSNEALDATEIPEGWTLSDDGMSASKTYEANAEENVTFKDLAGNEAAVSVKIGNIDKTAPETEVSYSETEPTNNDVTVTVTSNEVLDAAEIPEGWTLSDDGMSASKTYEANAEETVTFKDLAGNEAAVSVKIENIDKTPLTLGTPEYVENADGSVTVKIKTDNDIDQTRIPEGWAYADDYVTKTFKKSSEELVTLYDKAGNSSSVTVKVTITDKTDDQKPGNDGEKPSDTQKPNDSKSNGKAVQTGDQSSPVVWVVVLVAACAAAGAVVVIRKKNKKK